MAVRSKAVEQAADELYALPPGEFTRARDERAKALRKDGQRDEADAVKALRKPTLAAWALNQLTRQRPKKVAGLIAAGEELRAAQQELLAGGDRKAFQSAAAKERDQVAKLARDAVELASEAGERGSPALTEKIAATLHAAALDEETAEELRAGRLIREREAIGGFGDMSAAVSTGDRTVSSKPAEPTKGRRVSKGSSPKAAGADRKPGKATGADDERRDETKRRAEADRRAEAERRQRLAAARTDERHARRELEAATKAMEHAQTRAEAARTHAEEANRRAKTTAERLRDARREQAAAKKAHARAERALAAADRDS